ncbi:MAG: hypothetical protein ABL986_07865 [Vicinamibacterales bacterium]
MIGPATGTERHLPILILLVRVWGALSMMIGVSMLLLAVGAVAILMDPAWPREAFGTGITVGAFAVVFGVLGAFALAWGAAHLWAGTLLRDHRPIGRILTLTLSVVNLLVLPFGTAMGAYALWILMTADARHLFEAAAPAR